MGSFQGYGSDWNGRELKLLGVRTRERNKKVDDFCM